MGSTVLMGKGAKAEDKELASAIMAGEMKNAWEVEDRPNRVDQRPPEMRSICARKKSKEWYENYDRTFRRKSNNGTEKKEG